ncbi:ABC transporter family protein, partial [Vibrio parahaemolyticus V-223/04]
VTYRVV